MVDVGVGQDDGLDRRIAQRARFDRLQFRRLVDLLADVGRGVEQYPIRAVRETAREDCSLALYPAMPARTLDECKPLQFHCGNPPPAADPRTFMII